MHLPIRMGYDVGIREVSYTDSKTGRRAKGRILVDNNNPKESLLHFRPNGKLPGFEHEGKDPLSAKIAKPGDRMDYLVHGRNLSFICGMGSSYEEIHAKNYAVSGQRGSTYEDFLYREVFQKRLSRADIRDNINKGNISCSIQTERDQLGGERPYLDRKIGTGVLTIEVGVKDRILIPYLKDPVSSLYNPSQPYQLPPMRKAA